MYFIKLKCFKKNIFRIFSDKMLSFVIILKRKNQEIFRKNFEKKKIKNFAKKYNKKM